MIIINRKDGDGGVTVEPITITEDGVYTAPSGKAYSPVTVETGSPFPPVIKRKTGNPIELTDAASAPLVKCVTQITGSQDLHGYDKPWVGGAGKNKLNVNATTKTMGGVTLTAKSDGTFETIGIATEDIFFLIYGTWSTVVPLADGDYILNGCPANGGTQKYFLQLTKSNGGYVQNTGNDSAVFSIDSSNKVQSALIFIKSGVNTDGLIFRPMIRLSTETDSTFAPYSNICPITAYTEGEIEVRGKNLLPNGTVGGQYYSPEGNIITNAQIVSFPTILFTPGNYNMSFVDKTPTGTNSYIRMNELDENENFVSRLSTTQIHENTFRFSFSRNAYVQFAIDIYLEGLMLVLGFTPSTYEPYTSTTHTTTYPSAIFRGSEDVVNGEVKSEMPLVDLDALSPNTRYTGTMNKTVSFTLPGNYTYNSSASWALNCISEQFEYKGKVQGASALSNPDNLDVGIYAYYASGTGTTNTIYLVVPVGITAYGKFAYELATPTTSSVTPTNLPIKSLSGYNHIESSTGDMVVDYITDAYQNFVDTTERAIPNTRKGGTKAMDIFMTLDEPGVDEPEKEVDEKEEEKK